MPYKLIARAEQTFRLERTDAKFENEGDPTTVTIRQASMHDVEERGEVNNELIQEMRPDESNRLIFKYSFWRLHRVEVFLTLKACNILDLEGKPLFRFKDGRLNMTLNEFTRVWGSLDPTICDEIHEKVLILNPDWRIGEQGETLGEGL